MGRKRIAVIGGGAKAAAIAAKAASLRDRAGIEIEVVVFERARIGANWSGDHGYTDGLQALCTPADRDIGFPYATWSFGPSVAEDMQARFSWPAFLIATDDYQGWIDQGRPRPTHRQFAAYLDFCIKRADARVINGDVVALDVASGQWTITHDDRLTQTRKPEPGFDGLVVTGAGPAKRLSKFTDLRLFDGHSFWSALDGIPATAGADPGMPVVIIGAGGTAAACAGWLARARVTNPIIILSRRSTLFARTDSAFENRAFLDSENWALLSVEDRRQFTDRLTRSAVWQSVLEDLSRAPNVTVQAGDAKAIRNEPPGDPDGELFVEYTTSAAPEVTRSMSAALVIDATGFDPWWFDALLPSNLKTLVQGDRLDMMSRMDGALALPLPGPSLHAPPVSQVASPAFSSLMALGAMSDAVLFPYVTQLT